MDPLEPGDPSTIGRYRLAGRLGRGGMGEVFFGHSPGGRAVAVKVIRPELAADPQFRRRFAQEVEAARLVGGFHTAPVVDADLAADPPWLVTAYVPGPSLADVVAERGPLPGPALRILGAGLAEALEAIHAAGLVHRDLKPSNILLTDDGPRVIDFGIARAADSTALTRVGATIGTPGFMAPEHISGPGAGTAADVFALGAVLCFAAGIQPFGAGPAPALMYRIVHDDPDLRGLPEELTAVVAACLHKDPAARPAPGALLTLLGTARPDAQRLPTPVAPHLTDHREALPTTELPADPALPPAHVAFTPPGDRPARPGKMAGIAKWVASGAVVVGAAAVLGWLVAGHGSTPAARSSATPTAGTDSPAPAENVQRCRRGSHPVRDYKGRTFATWTCATEKTGAVYLTPAVGEITGYLKAPENWFVCQRAGALTSDGQRTVWVYTQGDDHYRNQGWGWFPATSVSSTWKDQTIPDLPACS